MRPTPDYHEVTPEDLPEAFEVATRTGMAVRIGTTQPEAYLVPAALYHRLLRRAYPAAYSGAESRRDPPRIAPS